MSFLTSYNEDGVDVVPPRRVYGRVDHREPPDGDPDGPRSILLDSVDADWFDDIGGKMGWFGAADVVDEADRHVSVVEARFGCDAPPGPPDDRTQEGRWLELTFTEGDAVAHYLNLYAAPLRRDVTGWWPVHNAATRERLERATGLDDLPDASTDELRAALARASARDGVAVYDVGHGACNALITDGYPSLYFDFGGGCNGNARTFPRRLRHFCMTAEPVIVLSHWDFDHWSSGPRDPRSMKMTWIVPRQRMGAVHTAFLGQLLANGRVLVWPRGLAALRAGDVLVEQCTGAPNGRNDSGLAMVVFHPDGSRILLPADAGYAHIPSLDGSYASVTVPHHGGRSAPGAIALSDRRPSGRCVYSTGEDNSYCHPFPTVEAAHADEWRSDLRTEHRSLAGLGHVHLYWDADDPDVLLGCRGMHCDLACQQR
jgi:hypothetical protein